MAKNLQAEKKILELLRVEVAYALVGAEINPGRLDEFENFLSALRSFSQNHLHIKIFTSPKFT